MLKKITIVVVFQLSAIFGQVTIPNATPSPWPNMQFLDTNGAPIAGGKLCSYLANTSTPSATYTDSTAGTPNANPLILDSAGRATVFIGPRLYKMVLRSGGTASSCNDGTVVWSADNFGDTAAFFINYVKTAGSATLISYTNPASGAVQRTQYAKNNEVLSLQDFGAVCDGSNDDTAAITAALAVSSLTQAVFVPAGVCTSTIQIEVTHPIILVGDSWTFKYTGGGAVDAVLKLNGGPATIPHGALMQGSTITGGVFDGGNLAANGIQFQAVVSAQITYVRVINTTDTGFLVDWGQQIEFDHCQVSKDFDVAANMPAIGFKISGVSSANYLLNVNVDHVSSHGIDLDYAINTIISGGSSEGNGGYGINFNGTQAFNNAVYNMDLEANTLGDYFFGSGTFFNSVLQSNSSSDIGAVFDGSAHSNTIVGGLLGINSTAAVNSYGNRLINIGFLNTGSDPLWTDLGQNCIDRLRDNFHATFVEPYCNYQTSLTWGFSAAALQRIAVLTPSSTEAEFKVGDPALNWTGFDCQDGFGSCWFEYPHNPSTSAGGIQFISRLTTDGTAINDGSIKNHQWCFGRFCQTPLTGLSADFYDQGSGHGTTVGVRAESGQGGNDLFRWYGYDAVTPPIISKVTSDGTFTGPTGAGGTTFAVSGCGAASLTGGSTGGTFTVTTTGACTATITMGDSLTATHGWNCSANNVTTANLLRGVPNSATTAKLIGTTVSGDTLSFACSKY